MSALRRTAQIAERIIFAVTDPIVKPARALGMFDPKRVGATAIAYGLIPAGISVAIIAVVQGLGQKPASQNPPVITAPAAPAK